MTMTMTMAMTAPRTAAVTPAVRWFAAVRAGYGLGLLCAPGRAAELSGGAACDTRFRAVARVLGARHCAQALVTACRPSPAVLLLGAGTDIAHAASMLALAASHGRRRAGLTDAAAATAFASAGLVIAVIAVIARPAWSFPGGRAQLDRLADSR